MRALQKIVVATGLVALGLVPRLAAAADDPAEAYGGAEYGGVTTETPEEMTPAQPQQEPAPGTQREIEEYDEQMMPPRAQPVRVEQERSLITPWGMGISAGGGVQDFVDKDADRMTDVGGAWDVRLTFGTKAPIGFEAAYIGSANNIDAIGLDTDAVLVSNGAEGLVRVNLGAYRLQPFVFGGAGWSRYDLTNEDFNTSSVNSQDDVFAIPFGAGLSGYAGTTGLMLDARFTYRATYDEDLFRPGTGNERNEDLDHWSVTGRIGYEF